MKRKYKQHRSPTIYGFDVEITMICDPYKRWAKIYTNAHDKSRKTFGVIVQGSTKEPNPRASRSYQRWQGGSYLGAFSYRKARKLAINFVLHNRLPVSH